MPPLFWLDIAALSLSTMIATSLVLMVLGAGPRRTLNRSFALFTLMGAAWAVFSLLLRLALWLEKGNPLLLSELAALTFSLMGPFLLIFTARYVGHHTRWPDLAAALGLATMAVLTIPLFHHQLLFNPRLDINGSTTMDLSAWGMVVAVVPASYLVWSLVLFWQERRRIREPYLTLSVLTLMVGFVLGGVLEIRFPVLSITNTLSVAILGYRVISQQLFNPLRERTAELQRQIAERKRAERSLQALNQAALAMEQALTPEEIFATVAEEFKKLSFSCAVFLTDESQSRLSPRYLSYEARALKAAEKLTNLKREDFSIPIEKMDIYREIVREKKTVFVENIEEVTRQWLPEPTRRFTGQILRILKIPKAINAPLIVEDQVIGLLSVQSDDLTEDDIPAITAFAHQMAAAWHKARLMQDLQSSLEELRRTQAQLVQAQKMEAIGQLAGGIAHDFNNLLTTIVGFTRLLLREAPEGSQQREDLCRVEVAAERAAALTRQLRLFTRQEKGERRPVRLNSVVEETHNLLKRSIPKEITIELRLEPKLWAVEADPSQISQVLVNLCVNARDAMPNGGTLTLETKNVTLDEEEAQANLAARPGRYVRLSASDTGIGMSPEVQARLFEPFFTTKEMGKGSGLGLAVVYGIVKGHNGFINIYSEVGQGSTFHVYLPAIELSVEERKVEVLELPTGTETILLVDDEEAVWKLGQRVLGRCGYTVLKAENGVQALEVYQAHQEEIALVVLDVVMPEMGGRECLRRLRGIDPQVKVLISTGYTADSSTQKLVAEGALGVVEKPFLLQDLAVAVRAALDEP